ncbi:MAG: cytochrome c biogenesis protein ResB [Deltaproteobacteria bacterium]|nr:cytochrome c biogenesis protein ResB [Deltaproteobacteria bacterium]
MSADEPVKTAKTEGTDWIATIWNFLTSLKLVVILLLILSALSIAGTVIEQNKPLQEYYRYYQPGTVALFSKLGLFDMYHSWWFVACLSLLALNITACTMDRYRGIMAGMRKRNLILDEKLSKSLQNLTTIRYALPLDAVEKKMVELAGKEFPGKPVVTAAEEGGSHYFFEKGKYSRLAFFMTHLSILIIFLGALIGSFFGYKGYVNIFEGETVSQVETRAGKIQNLNFQVKCNTFNAEFYASGMPMDYRSDLSILQNGKEVVRKTIRVNDPLTFEGVTFYQSSYGGQPDQVAIEAVSRDGSVKGTVTAPFGRVVDIPGMAEEVEAADYQEHFHLPDGSEGGRAVGVNIYPAKGGAPAGVWLLVNDPEYDKRRGGDTYFRVRDLKLKKYTGLQVNRDPGEILVWLGSILLIAGIMIAFFMSHKKLWISLRTDNKGRSELTIGGTANKNRDAFAREMEQMIQSLKEVS